jgi:negative regulator of sigma-B (phosphoserine phosphatase)
MEFGTGQRAKIGRDVCGDAFLIKEAGTRVVVAVADGLGSGPKAHLSSEVAMQGVAEHLGFELTDILTYCHYAILTRGGVGVMMAIMRLDRVAHTLEFAGVGNIRFLAHSREVIQPILRYGYLGARLPRLQGFRFTYTPGDCFVLHTDGISSRLHLHNHLSALEQGAQHCADLIMETYSKDHDDVTVVVVKTGELHREKQGLAFSGGEV